MSARELVNEQILINNTHVIYCFCFCPDSLNLIYSIDKMSGYDNSPLFLWRYLGIVAVLCAVSREEFCGPLSELRMQNITWLGSHARHHEEVIEEIMHHVPVLPTRFGTLFSSLDKLQELLTKHYSTITDFFTRLANNQEWAVKGFLNRQKAQEHFFSLLLQRQQEKLSSLSKGIRYFHEQQIRIQVDKELGYWLKQIYLTLANRLNNCTVNFRERKILSRDIYGKNMDMTLNWAFLVKPEAIREFHACISETHTQCAQQGLAFELSGPWPPYSFVPSLEIET
ncbi:MAG: GvpL/GvpF family gas vesicle protein [Acidobacteriota bacterium]